MKKQKSLFYIFLLFSAIFWGSSFVFTKHLLDDFSPISIIFIRSFISSIFLLVICFLFFRKYLVIEKKDKKLILAFSFFEPFLYFLFETYSLRYTSASIISIIVATIPLFTALVSKYYFKEAFSKINMIGAIVSLLGIFIMLLPEFSQESSSVLGVVLAFCAVLAAIGYGFFLKKLPATYHPVVIVTYQNVIGTVLFLPLFFVLGAQQGFPQIKDIFEPLNFSYLIMLSIFCSSLAFIFFIQGVQNLGLGKSNIFNNLIPVITAIISFLLLKEDFPFHKISGMVVVITGIFLVQKK